MKLQIVYTTKKANFRKQAGFTLIEMLVVISLILILGGLTLFFGIDSLRGYSFHSDRDVLVSTLQHARSEAISNICRGDTNKCANGSKPQGVYIDTTNRKFIIFQGSSFVSRDIEQDVSLDFNPGTVFPNDGSIHEIVFTQLSGDVAIPGFITITEATDTHTSKIEINKEGQILWSN
jgi:prepilin-type N-terminal cleavage/methylation domain-containing protein